MLNPLDPEVFGRIKADHRARRGPFAYAVVRSLDLVAHYDIRSIKVTQATWLLRQIGTREVLVSGTPRSRLFVVDPTMELSPAETRKLLLRERGLPET